MKPYYERDGIRVLHGDCLEILRDLPEGYATAIVTDPPYGLEFMGKEWDRLGQPKGFRIKENPADIGRDSVFGRTSRTSPEYVAGAQMQEWHRQWGAEALRVLRPGGLALVFGGTRTFHRLACGLEDAGFEIRDCLMWLYGQGFPKAKTCLKPAWEPILLARKPGPRVDLNIDECRIPADPDYLNSPGNSTPALMARNSWAAAEQGATKATRAEPNEGGRWPANVILDEESAAMLDEQTGELKSGTAVGGLHRRSPKAKNYYSDFPGRENEGDVCYGDSGGASRFFYCAKASKRDRGEGNAHPTVKPVELMRWLVRLVNGFGESLILDPFAGSGTTGVAAQLEHVPFLLIEREEHYCEIAANRLAQGVLGFDG